MDKRLRRRTVVLIHQEGLYQYHTGCPGTQRIQLEDRGLYRTTVRYIPAIMHGGTTPCPRESPFFKF